MSKLAIAAMAALLIFLPTSIFAQEYGPDSTKTDGFLTTIDGQILVDSGRTITTTITTIKIEGQMHPVVHASGLAWDHTVDVQLKCFEEGTSEVTTTVQEKVYILWFRDDIDTDLPPDGVKEERWRHVTVNGAVCSGVVQIVDMPILIPDRSYSPQEMKDGFAVDPDDMKIKTCPEHTDDPAKMQQVREGINNAIKFKENGGKVKTFWDYLAESIAWIRNWGFGV